MITDITKMETILKKKPRYDIRTLINPLGQHNETYWKQAFAAFYTWLMKNIAL